MTLPDAFRILRWVIGSALVLAGGFAIGINWATLVWNARFAAQGVDRHVSSTPIVGPLLMTHGLACIFWGFSPHYVWPWLLDWPTATLPVMLWRLHRRTN